MTLKQWDILECEQNNGCRDRGTKMWEEGQDSSSDPFQFSEIGITKSWKELVENILPLLPDDENVSVTWHHRVKPVSFPCGSAGLPSRRARLVERHGRIPAEVRDIKDGPGVNNGDLKVEKCSLPALGAYRSFITRAGFILREVLLMKLFTQEGKLRQTCCF